MKKGFVISTLISIIAAGIAVWFILTTKGDIPINWDAKGNITEYSSSLMLLIFPAIGLIASILLYLTPRFDPKGDNIKNSGPILPITMILIAVMMLGIEVFIIMTVNSYDIFSLNLFISLILGVMLTVIGYYMPSVKPNYMVGIRTPWTLYSEDIWTKTHEASQKPFIAIGLSFFVCLFLPQPFDMVIPAIITAVVVIGIVVYSYILFAKEKDKKKKKK